MDITYLVSTHVDYDRPLEQLLKSMWYIDRKRIIVVAAGAGFRYQGLTKYGNPLYIVPHNSFDYTALIEMMEGRFSTTEHIMCLQDTMVAGINTEHLLLQADPLIPATAAFGTQCNLVLYRADYLFHHSDYILRRRDLSKTESIREEGKLWLMTSQHAMFPNAGCEELGIAHPYSTVPRIKEYYPAVDIIKYKANYGQNMHALITKP